MVKTMRSLLFCTVIATAVADNADCAVDGAQAMNQFSDAAIFVWAATKRCGKATESQVKCEVDITSAMQSVTDMIGVIVSAVGDCGAIETDHQACGMAVGELTSAAAGLAAASGGIADACPKTKSEHNEDKKNGNKDKNNEGKHKNNGDDSDRKNGQDSDSSDSKTKSEKEEETEAEAPKTKDKHANNLPDGKPTGLGQATNLGLCIVDAKSVVASLFSASKLLSEAGGVCQGKEFGSKSSCAHKALDIVSALADMGSFLGASVNDCTSLKGDGNADADCSSNILAAISSLHAVAEAGMHIDRDCRAEGFDIDKDIADQDVRGRLFLADQDIAAKGTSFFNLALVACLPVAAVLSFVLGRRTRADYQLAPARELEAAM